MRKVRSIRRGKLDEWNGEGGVGGIGRAPQSANPPDPCPAPTNSFHAFVFAPSFDIHFNTPLSFA